MTERATLQTQEAKMSFLHRVAGLSLRDGVRGSDIREVLGVEIEKSLVRQLGYLVRMHPW